MSPLREAYLIVFDSFAIDAPDLAHDMNIEVKDARSLLKKLEPLVVSDHVNGERTLVYQCWETCDNLTREEAEALFDKTFPTTDKVEVKSGAHATGPTYTDEQLEIAAELKGQGKTWTEIAKELDIKTPARLSMRVRRAGLI